MRRWFTWVLLAALACAVVLVVAACGGDDDDSEAGGETAAESPDERASAAMEAGTAAAEAAGEPVEVPQLTVGFVNILGAVESAQRAERTFRQATDILGWQVESCDAQGDPTLMARCANSLLDQNVDVLTTLGIEPSLIMAPLQKAQRQNIPVVSFSGQVADSPLWAGSYYPDEAGAGQVLTDYLMEQLNGLEQDTVPIAIHDYPADWSAERTDTLRAAVSEQDKVDIAVDFTTDATNLVEGTRQAVTDQLTANPDLKAFWFGFDSAGQAGGQAVAAQFPGESFPEKPLVVTFHADLATNDLIRAGSIDAVQDVPYDAAGWIATDQIAEFFARETPMAQEPQPEYEGMGSIYDYVVVDTSNLPPEGEYRAPENDFETFFTTKWTTEFTNASA